MHTYIDSKIRFSFFAILFDLAHEQQRRKRKEQGTHTYTDEFSSTVRRCGRKNEANGRIQSRFNTTVFIGVCSKKISERKEREEGEGEGEGEEKEHSELKCRLYDRRIFREERMNEK